MEWIPEAKPPAGGLAAEGFYKLLGRPRLDPLTVLVRETAQNSWDARIQNGQPVDFTIQGWVLSKAETDALRNDVFIEASEAKGTNLDQELSKPDLLGLYITDRNTKGLGGPVTADQVDPSETYDWVDFVLNVGEANTQGQTGGTYGFGKTISYIVSSANAIVIHSRTIYRGRLQTRLIACALGTKFSREGKLYTGRHWWGVNDQGAPTPIVGRAADRIATQIGMPEFEGDSTGTNILVVAPEFGGRSNLQAMTFIAETVTWHLWPKMVRHRETNAMNIDVSWNGNWLQIPRPEDRPPLHGFAQAFEAIRNETQVDSEKLMPGTQIDEIRSQRPNTHIGRLVTVPLVQRERTSVDDGSNTNDNDAPKPAAAITGLCHHVALLRSPELVVEYHEGPPPPEGGFEWAGVFRVDDEKDRPFALAEPPTHDSWNPELLPKSQDRTIVNVALREIRTALDARWGQRKQALAIQVASTGLIADELAHLVGAIEGRGAGKWHREAGQSLPKATRPKIDFVFSKPMEIDGALATLARVNVTPAPGNPMTRVHFNVAAALDGVTADNDLDPLLRFVAATVNGQSTSATGLNGSFEFASDEPFEVELVVRRGASTTVLFEVEAEPIS